LIVRIPGIGIQSAQKICAARKFRRLNSMHLKKLGIAYNRAKYFIECAGEFELKDWQPQQLKSFILKEAASKYKPNFSPQLNLF
jgi:predicted DNA-binding helix-hairpin-helix protein